MNGTVEAANLPDHGAVFIVAIPSLPPADWEETAPCARLDETIDKSVLKTNG